MCLDTRLTKMSVALAALFGAQAVQSSSSPKGLQFSFVGAASQGSVDSDDEKHGSPESDDGRVDGAAAAGMSPAHRISHAQEIPQRGLPRPQRARGLPRPESVELEAPEFFNAPDIMRLHAQQTERDERDAMYTTKTKQPDGIIAMNISSPMRRFEATEAECAHKMSECAISTKDLPPPAQKVHRMGQMNGHHMPSKTGGLPVPKQNTLAWSEKVTGSITMTGKNKSLMTLFQMNVYNGKFEEYKMVFKGWTYLNPSEWNDKASKRNKELRYALHFTLVDKTNPNLGHHVFTAHKLGSQGGSKKRGVIDLIYHNGFVKQMMGKDDINKKQLTEFFKIYDPEENRDHMITCHEEKATPVMPDMMPELL